MKNCYFAMLLLLSAAFAAGCADDKEEGGNDIKLNPRSDAAFEHHPDESHVRGGRIQYDFRARFRAFPR